MSKSTISEKPALRILDIHASEVEKYPNTLKDIMFNRSFEGMIIRGVLSPETVEQVVSRLENGAMKSLYLARPTQGVDRKYKPIEVYGQTLIGTSPSDLNKYFDCATAFRQECSILFQGHPGLEERIEAVLHGLSGLPVRVPKGPEEGQTYTPATIRALFEGDEMPIHAGNQLIRLPQSAHLNTLIDITDQFSYFIPITVPEVGGELIIYTLEWNPEEKSEEKAVDPMLEQKYESVAVAPNPGDMLVFDGGRYYHRVTPVSGSRPRRTIGGFMAFSKQHDAFYYWS
jgi:hypothetical protein